MKKITFLLLLVSVILTAQNSDRFYATMNIVDARALANDMPSEIEILTTHQNEAAVYMTEIAAHALHDRILVHGPGYIFKASEEEVMEALLKKPAMRNNRMPFTITEDAVVNQVLGVVNTQNIEDHILELEAYGTRFHSTSQGSQASEDLKSKWEAMAAAYNRTDVSVRLFQHNNTNMPSVIMTIEGAELPEEFVIVGGHLDSTSFSGSAPGADDDASGIATITEAARSLFEIGYKPKRTIEIMAYAAEEIGLVGSAEIASEYADNNVDVVGVAQFDMTNYNGSVNDIYFITDFTSALLNSYLMDLLEHYNASGEHEITYDTSLCNYGCSDHASWTNEGFLASFPFEVRFSQHNDNIHTPNDTYAVSGTSEHATKFAKLCAEFLIEAAKTNTVLAVGEATIENVFITIDGNSLSYDISASSQSFERIQLFNVLGTKVFDQPIEALKGSWNVSSLASGVYVASIAANNGTVVTKKLIKE